MELIITIAFLIVFGKLAFGFLGFMCGLIWEGLGLMMLAGFGWMVLTLLT